MPTSGSICIKTLKAVYPSIPHFFVSDTETAARQLDVSAAQPHCKILHITKQTALSRALFLPSLRSACFKSCPPHVTRLAFPTASCAIISAKVFFSLSRWGIGTCVEKVSDKCHRPLCLAGGFCYHIPTTPLFTHQFVWKFTAPWHVSGSSWLLVGFRKEGCISDDTQ